MRRAAFMIVIALAGAAVTAIPAAASEPRASLTDIEDEVMCPICGTPLNLAAAPQAERERAFIRRLIARGETKQ
jgi:cytochrome c-type biogenesis protein CcmH